MYYLSTKTNDVLLAISILPRKNPLKKLKIMKWYKASENGTIIIDNPVAIRKAHYSLVIWLGNMWEINPKTKRPATCVSPLKAKVNESSSRYIPLDTAVSGNKPVGIKYPVVNRKFETKYKINPRFLHNDMLLRSFIDLPFWVSAMNTKIYGKISKH